MSSEQIDPSLRAEIAAVGTTGSVIEVVDFLRGITPVGPWSLTAIRDGVLTGKTFDQRSNQDLNRWLRERLGRTNLYWQVNPLRRELTDKAPKARLEDVMSLDRLHVDIDPDHTAPGTVEEQRAAILALLQDEDRLKEAGLPGGPTIIVDSGNGYWAFWDLVEPLALGDGMAQERRDRAFAAGGYNKWLVEKLNAAFGFKFADDCHNIDRIARLPATLNIPPEKKRLAGRVATIGAAPIFYKDRVYQLSQFDCVDLGPASACRETIEAIKIEGNWEPLPTGDGYEALQELRARYAEVQETTIQRILFGRPLDDENLDKSEKFDRSAQLYNVNCALCYAGVPLPLIVAITSDKRFKISEHLRFPANKGGVPASREVSGRDLQRAAEYQVKAAAADIQQRRKDKAELEQAEAALDNSLPPQSEQPAEAEQEEANAPPSIGYGPFPAGARLNDVFRIMNRRHAVLLQEGGKTRVLSWERTELDYSREVPVLQSFEDFRNRYMHQQIQVGMKDGNPILKPIGKVWLEHPARREYLALRFQPGEGPVVDGYLNLWRGFACQPREGSWSRMQAHIVDVLAEGRQDYATYIIKWAAWSLQNPSEPAEVALVFKGGRGVGKGTFARALKRLFGQHGLQITSSGHLTGRFNAHLRDCCLLFADEAIVPEDKKAESILKGLITEPEITIEGKGVNATQARNRLHIVMASNEEWVIPAGVDERRFAIFEATDAHRGDHAYFAALNEQMDNGGMEAMLHDLLNMDLEGWHPRKDVPNTEALQKQKEHSLGAGEQFILGILEDGHIPGEKINGSPRAVYSSDHMSHKGLYTCMREASPKLRDLSDRRLSMLMRKWGCEPRSTGSARGWEFPLLEEMRTAWDQRYGKREWAPIRHWDAPLNTPMIIGEQAGYSEINPPPHTYSEADPPF